jgi:tripartite-type tricarboxylate transporter receptor subunit TctC
MRLQRGRLLGLTASIVASPYRSGAATAQAYPLGVVVDALNKEINASLADRKVRTQLGNLGGTTMESTPGEFRNFVASETEKWRKVIKLSGTNAN